MKFYGKVFLSMLVLVSLSFGVFGTLLIQYSFQSALDREIEMGKTENQMMKLTFETTANSIPEAYFDEEKTVLKELAQSIKHRIGSKNSTLLIMDEQENMLYSDYNSVMDELLYENISTEESGYRIYENQGKYYLNVMSIINSNVTTQKMWLQTSMDITSIYSDRKEMLRTYRMIMIIMLVCVALVVLILSYFLTRSVRKLSKAAREFAKGDMEARVTVKGRDEVSVLAQDFNHMADELAERMESLAEQARRQEEFTSAFAHELKTPLTSIIGYADMIRSMNLQEEERIKAAGYIYSQGKRLEALSFKLLDLFVMKKQNFEFVKLEAPYFIQTVFDLAEVGVIEKKMTLKKKAEKGIIYGEKDLLISLFANLIDNSKKASTAGDTIWIEGRAVDGGYEISVRDEGRGIPKEELGRITDAFYMVDKSRSRKEGGAGLGMTLCREIVRMHGAKWRIESEAGNGTCVTVTFCKEETK